MWSSSLFSFGFCSVRNWKDLICIHFLKEINSMECNKLGDAKLIFIGFGGFELGQLNYRSVRDLLSTIPTSLEKKGFLLHLAAWSGHAEVVNYLCNKADIGAAAMDDMGAICFAAQKGHLEVIKILHTSGVSIKSYNRKGMTALHYAAQGSHPELVKYLVKKGANLEWKNVSGKSIGDALEGDKIAEDENGETLKRKGVGESEKTNRKQRSQRFL